ncbi:glutamyl aminopeptidase-like isoform X5 [Temnothorax nylanderi]|uniref:glutamyl aminopeptidase-like isoform X5 n=1 Tax=Temnothorax nylanderi TaxID=102681 RepID=UPI003A8874CC
MRLLQLLLTSIFIFIRVEYYYAYFDENGNNESSTEFSIESSTEDNLYLPDIVPEHYKIQLELAAEEDMFYGTSEVNITIKNATSLIYSHSELNITNVTLIEHNTTNETNKHIIQSYKYIKKMEIIVFYFDYELTPGKYMLNMAFTSIINNNIGGFFKTSYRNDTGDLKWLIATRTWTMGARRMFPCWDEPKFQAKFTITIEHHAKYTALSNMPISTSETINDTAITSFNTTPAISTHLIVIVLCDLTISTENINWRGRKQSISDQSFASFIATAFTLYFETKWKELQNFSNVQHVAIPGLLDDGMAKWAFISYREEDIICNEELDYYPAAQHIKVVSLIGRKISRQWLSTVVSPSSWSYMWLNEGIATFFYIEDVVKKTSGSSWSDLFAIQTMQESLHLDVLSIMSPLISKTDQFSDINSIFSLSYYVKAPFIMRMLQRILGDKVFRNGINTYFKRQSASLNDFWADMQTAYEEELPEILLTLPINIKKVMDPWIEQKSFPVLLVQIKVLNQLRPVLRKIGYEEYSEDNDFTKCLRQEAAKWACVLGDPKCKTEAVTKLKWHLEKPKNNKLLPSWTYCNGLAVADVVTLHLYMQDTFIYEKNTKMFEFLACSDEPLIILRMFILDMKSKLNNGYSLINKNHIDLFHYIVMRHARNNTILDNIFNSWDFFKPKEISTITALIGIINNVYSEKQLDKIMTFVKNIKEILLTIIVHPLIRNSLESRTQNCTEHAKMIRDKIIQFQICSIQTKVNIRKSQIERQVNKFL